MKIIKLFSFLLPWFLRRRLLNSLFKFEIHPSARIGWAWVFPKKLVMAAGSRIDHFTVAIHLDSISLGKNTLIGRSNWITGASTFSNSKHFNHQPERKAELIVGDESAITKNHHIDCTNTITIGKYCTVAGYNSQLLTHSINLNDGRQDSRPIDIGDYTFVGTNVVILGGARLPSYSVLGAKSLLINAFTEEWTLYGGIPSKPLSPIKKEAKYFSRETGFVY